MVKGLDRFREHFAEHADRYVIIGGTACDLAISNAGLEFRSTKDIDVVLCLETIDSEFARAFWSFVKAGAYESLEAPPEVRTFYRFSKPRVDGYPAMVELFSRLPDVFKTQITGRLAPIPMGDDVSSLSAILLDSEYYSWIHSGRTIIDGLPVVRPEHLIPLKARAWLDLTSRHADSRDIKKHKNDVFRLYAVTDPEYVAQPTAAIRADIEQFVRKMRDESIDLKAFGLAGMSRDAVLDALLARYA